MKKVLVNSFGAATGDGAYRTKKTLSKADYDFCKNKVFEIIKDAISKFSGTNYRKWHSETCDKILSVYTSKGEIAWTYGNSQKIVNLVIKYLIVVGSCCKKLNKVFYDYSKEFIKISNNVDIPVDSFIISAVECWNVNNCNSIWLPLDSKGKLITWSNWNKDQYISFVESFHRVFTTEPLKWEAYAWTQQKYEHSFHNAISLINSKDADNIAKGDRKIKKLASVNYRGLGSIFDYYGISYNKDDEDNINDEDDDNNE